MEKTEGKIRYGLIGIGAQGGSYARFLTNAPAPFPGMVCAPCPDNCALGALCDIDPEKEKMCKEQYPDVPFFKDWKDMIASGTVDAIITTVPHYLHHEISIYAMEHGMNVLCERLIPRFPSASCSTSVPTSCIRRSRKSLPAVSWARSAALSG